LLSLIQDSSAGTSTQCPYVLTFPLLGLVPELRPWLPGHLLGAHTGLAAGAEPEVYLRAAVVTVVATAALLPATAALLGRREL
jgi:hypothetical protein